MIFTNFTFHVLDELPGYEGRPDAYQALCYLWDSKEFQQKSQKEKNYRVKSGKYTFGAIDMFVCPNQW
jgi:hypothetical protein